MPVRGPRRKRRYLPNWKGDRVSMPFVKLYSRHAGYLKETPHPTPRPRLRLLRLSITDLALGADNARIANLLNHSRTLSPLGSPCGLMNVNVPQERVVQEELYSEKNQPPCGINICPATGAGQAIMNHSIRRLSMYVRNEEARP